MKAGGVGTWFLSFAPFRVQSSVGLGSLALPACSWMMSLSRSSLVGGVSHAGTLSSSHLRLLKSPSGIFQVAHSLTVMLAVLGGSSGLGR